MPDFVYDIDKEESQDIEEDLLEKIRKENKEIHAKLEERLHAKLEEENKELNAKLEEKLHVKLKEFETTYDLVKKKSDKDNNR